MRTGRGLRRARLLSVATMIGVSAMFVTVTAADAGSAHATKKITPKAYVALGDSYTSGVGTLNYYPASGSCLRSPEAYPVLVAKKFGYKLHFAACSGGTTKTLLYSQLGALNNQTKLVTVQIGGNDAGFGTVIGACLKGTAAQCTGAITAADTFITKGLPKLLSVTYSKIRAHAKNARILALGYPRLFPATGTTCASLPMLTTPLELALNVTADDLDSSIAMVAKTNHFTFVDPRAAYANNEECSASPYLTGIITANDGVASFHPNALGEAAFAKLIEAKL